MELVTFKDENGKTIVDTTATTEKRTQLAHSRHLEALETQFEKNKNYNDTVDETIEQFKTNFSDLEIFNAQYVVKVLKYQKPKEASDPIYWERHFKSFENEGGKINYKAENIEVTIPPVGVIVRTPSQEDIDASPYKSQMSKLNVGDVVYLSPGILNSLSDEGVNGLNIRFTPDRENVFNSPLIYVLVKVGVQMIEAKRGTWKEYKEKYLS